MRLRTGVGGQASTSSKTSGRGIRMKCIRTELEGVEFITEKYEIQAMDERTYVEFKGKNLIRKTLTP